MKILVIGGSYFLGRVFTMLAAPVHEVTLLNRGSYSMEALGVRQWRADRHDRRALAALPAEQFDVIVDFCAYQEGDIAGLLEALGSRTFRYMLISTVDVYEKWTGRPLTEAAPLASRRFGGENGEYIWQKILLEQELECVCKEYKMARTVVRPALLYGPFNYAMREAAYVRMALQGEEILCPQGAKGRFQPVYVKDAAAMVLALCQKETAADSAYNLAGPAVDYEGFLEAFARGAKCPVKIKKIPWEEAERQNAFLPFPLTEKETEYYDGARVVEETGLPYLPLTEGLSRTWESFARVFA